VDSDTSTSDTILAFALGTSNHSPVKNDKELKDFAEKFTQINQELAQLVIRDGEGITKFITINILGGKSYKMAKEVGLAIGNSPLVKTALFASDPNWGRIVMSAGKAGHKLDESKITLKIGSILVAQKGVVSKNYKESDCANYMKGKEILIELNLGLGKEKATIYTCDFSYDYIKINASYRS
jgi:glutamate N-acetyltransferase/amino-acid N-acetyltransferase